MGDGSQAVSVGVDIGGTAMRIVVRNQERWGDTLSVPTDSFASATIVERVERLAALITGLLPPGGRLVTVGIGASGPVDVGRGVIENAYTLPAFSGFPIVAALEARLECPVFIESDAVVAAVAEHRVGAGRGATRLVMVTLGTGIGVSLLIDGEPFRGPGGAHPEGGHIPVVSGAERCYCGITGCWEQVASRSALQARLTPLLPSGTPPGELLHHAAAAASTSAAVREVFTDYGRLVGRGLSALQTMYMPEVAVLGGSAASHLDLFRSGLEQELDRPLDFIPAMAIRGAVLQEAGTIGAALLADERVRTLRKTEPATAPAKQGAGPEHD